MVMRVTSPGSSPSDSNPSPISQFHCIQEDSDPNGKEAVEAGGSKDRFQVSAACCLEPTDCSNSLLPIMELTQEAILFPFPLSKLSWTRDYLESVEINFSMRAASPIGCWWLACVNQCCFMHTALKRILQLRQRHTNSKCERILNGRKVLLGVLARGHLCLLLSLSHFTTLWIVGNWK